MSDGWHYAQGQKSFGPLDLSKMQEVFSKASNPRNILVWKVGFKEWKRAEDVPELAGLIYKPPPLQSGSEGYRGGGRWVGLFSGLSGRLHRAHFRVVL